MKITLVAPYLDITALSIRSISASLRQEGHQVRLVFLPDLAAVMKHGVDFTGSYSERVTGQVADLCSDSRLVGYSLMTNYFPKIAELTRAVRKRTGLPSVWGGVHPTIAPEECAGVADYVCVGEGEGAIIELAHTLDCGQAPSDTANIAFTRNGSLVFTPPRPLIQDLDSLPFPDYHLEDQYVLVGDSVVPLSEELLTEMSRGRVNFIGPDHVVYETMWTRGCPYHCSFCINNALLELYPKQKSVRRRSVDHLMAELEWMHQRFPRFNRINFADDCFIYGSIDQLTEFSRRYRDSVNFPFFCLLSVQSVKEEKLKLLVDAGLRRVEVGIQSAAGSTNDLYRRNYFSADKLVECAQLLRTYLPDDVVPAYDVILENPYEEAPAVLETLRAVLRMPRPFVLQLFSLTFFPGTELYRKALADGTIAGGEDSYHKEDHHRGISWLNMLFLMVNKGVPWTIIAALAWKPLVLLMESRPIRRLFALGNRPYWAYKARRDRKSTHQRFGPLLDGKLTEK
jgi:anaerobic magnesium-protoporphyrin IX monomethyl ester cyclase